MNRLAFFVLLIAVSLVLAACSTSPHTEGDKPGPGDPDPGTPGPAECRITVSDSITVPTVFENGPEECDYFFAGGMQYEVTAEMLVEPGTVLLFAQDSTLLVTDSGSLRAVGSNDRRIVFSGALNTRGYWRGICFGDNRASRLENVDVLWAGKVAAPNSSACRGAISGSFGGGEPLDLVNVRQFGSHTNGLNAQQLPLGEFSGNAFGGNRDYGVTIDADKVVALDPGSDYLGDSLGEANGRPYIHVGGALNEPGRTYHWYALNVPYSVDSYAPGYSHTVFVDDGATLALHEGVRIHFGPETSFNVWNLSALEAYGTPANPVVFTGMQETRGSWDGVWVHDSRVNLHNLRIYWAGSPYVGRSSGLHLEGGFGTMRIDGLHVEGSESCGLTMDASAFSLLEVFANFTYDNNAADYCGP